MGGVYRVKTITSVWINVAGKNALRTLSLSILGRVLYVVHSDASVEKGFRAGATAGFGVCTVTPFMC